MPEFPEVTTVCRSLNSLLASKVFSHLEVFEPKLFKEFSIQEFESFLRGETIQQIYNIGKFIIWKLTNSKILLSHLRMEGKFYFFESSQQRKNLLHVRAIFHFLDGSCAYYIDGRMFGTFQLREDDSFLSIPPLSNVAKNPFQIETQELFDKLKNRRLPIKNALLNQSIISGIGNVYADEILYFSKIHPLREANSLSFEEIDKILNFSRKILEASIKMGGSSIHSFTAINTQSGRYQHFLKAYGRGGKPCEECKTIIQKIRLTNRGTHLCPTCQKI